MSREFLSDEIALMASDIQVLRNENELLKMTSERKFEEARLLRNELVELRAKYEDKAAEAMAIRTILENVGQVIHHGLQRYMERRTLKSEHVDRSTEERTAAAAIEREPTIRPEPPRPQGAPAASRKEPDNGTRLPVAVEQLPEDNSPPPKFLRSADRMPKNDIMSDADNMRALAEAISPGIKDDKK